VGLMLLGTMKCNLSSQPHTPSLEVKLSISDSKKVALELKEVSLLQVFVIW
jgi:hypothetical protein